MKREQQIEILMEDRCTKNEAERFLKNGTTIYDDFEENFDLYMEELKLSFPKGLEDEDYIELVDAYKKMIATGIPATDWGIVKTNEKTYYIQYVY